MWRYFEKNMAVLRFLGHFLVIWTEFPTFVFVNCYIYTFVTFFKDQSPMGDRFRTQFVVIPDVHINYILLYKIFCYFCVLITVASVQVEELQFSKVRNWRYLENFRRYLENF